MREYAWIDGRPLAAWKDVDTGNPIRYHVHVDHLDRPVMMTNTSKTIVWRAIYKPFGEVHSITGPAALDYRFPGQWFMLETGLHYNWHRWYDASVGRYTQPDLLGLFDGPSRYAYAQNSPLVKIDRHGLWTLQLGINLSGNAFGYSFSLSGGLAIDTRGNLGGYGEYYTGWGSSGTSWSAAAAAALATAATICDLAGPFATATGQIGAGPNIGGEVFTGYGVHGQPVTGVGVSVGVGAGGFASAGRSSTVIFPF
jgi:RHS repeat-associated protein